MPIPRTLSDAALARPEPKLPSRPQTNVPTERSEAVDSLDVPRTQDVACQTEPEIPEVCALPAIAPPAYKGPLVQIMAGRGPSARIFDMSLDLAQQFQLFDAAFTDKWLEGNEHFLQDTSPASAQVVHRYLNAVRGPYAPVLEELNHADSVPPKLDDTPAMHYVVDHLRDCMKVFIEKYHVATHEEKMQAYEVCLRLEKTIPPVAKPYRISEELDEKLGSDNRKGDLIKEAFKVDVDVLKALLDASVFSAERLTKGWVDFHYDPADDSSKVDASSKVQLFKDTRLHPSSPSGWGTLRVYLAKRLWEDPDPAVWTQIYALSNDHFLRLLKNAPEASTGAMSRSSAARTWVQRQWGECATPEDALKIIPEKDDRSDVAALLRNCVATELLTGAYPDVTAVVIDKDHFAELKWSLKSAEEREQFSYAWYAHAYAQCENNQERQNFLLNVTALESGVDAILGCILRDPDPEARTIISSLYAPHLEDVLSKSSEHMEEVRACWVEGNYTDSTPLAKKLRLLDEVHMVRHRGRKPRYVDAIMERVINDPDPRVREHVVPLNGSNVLWVVEGLPDAQRELLYTRRTEDMYKACGDATEKRQLFWQLRHVRGLGGPIAKLIGNDPDATLRAEILAQDPWPFCALIEGMAEEGRKQMCTEWMAPRYAGCADMAARQALSATLRHGLLHAAFCACLAAEPAHMDELLQLDAARFVEAVPHGWPDRSALWNEWAMRAVARCPDVAAKVALVDQARALASLQGIVIDCVLIDADASLWQELAKLDRARFMPILLGVRMADLPPGSADALLQGWIGQHAESLSKEGLFDMLEAFSQGEKKPHLETWAQERYKACRSTEEKLALYKGSVGENVAPRYHREDSIIAMHTAKRLIGEAAALPEGFLLELFNAYAGQRA